jgi:hypothetical protein
MIFEENMKGGSDTQRREIHLNHSNFTKEFERRTHV